MDEEIKNRPEENESIDDALAQKYQEVEASISDYHEIPKLFPQQPDPFAETPEPIPAEQPADPEPSAAVTEKNNRKNRARYQKRRAILITTRIGEVVRIFSIAVVIFAASIFLIVGARPTESAEENRMLATFPDFSAESLFDGSYLEDVMHYYEDTVPGRSTFKSMIQNISMCKGISDSDTVTFVGNVYQMETTTTLETTQTVAPAHTTTTTVTEPPETEYDDHGFAISTTTTAQTTEEPEPEVEIGDGIIIVGDRAMSLYGGSFTRGETYAETLNRYADDLKINVYSLVAPTAVSFYLPEEYQSYTASEEDNINHINEYLDGVIPIDAYGALEAHTDEDIYARTDHHWMPLGAYYAAEEFALDAGVPFADLSTYERVTKSGYIGSMYTYTQSAVIANSPEDFTYYLPGNSYTTHYYDTDFTNEREGNLLIHLDNVEPVSWYLVFMGGDEKIAHITTDVDNDRILVIMKDSYGNALVPFLTGSFSEIYVTDMRYFDLNAEEFCWDIGATDLLFAMNSFSATGSNSEYLEENRTK